MKKHLLFILIMSLGFNTIKAQTYYMNSAGNNTTVNTCAATIYDNGGPSSDYSSNMNVTRTFCSSNGGPIRISIPFLNIEAGFDYLYVYDGPNTSSTLLATLDGACISCPISYTSSGTCITIRFTSDGSVQYEDGGYYGGFQIGVGCVPANCNGNAPANDNCASATQICTLNGYCGSTSGYYTVDQPQIHSGDYGPYPYSSGNGEFCGSIENNSWLSFEADATSVPMNINVTGCTVGDGIQIVLLEGSCGSLTQVGSNCVSGITGSNAVTFNGLTIGNTYYIMIDGWAGDICNYVVTATGGIATINISDATGNLDSANYCQGECSTWSIVSSDPPTGYNWYSVPAGVSGTGATLNYCPASDMIIYCDIAGACGATVTAQFEA
ncbi:MAG: CUB domain-containing protein, partial [Bacteroidetes bacterium]|nr:CUB domain-containing protein [Bacteroidota bacterium]